MDIRTERLQLREFNLADALFIVELLNTPGWLRYIGDNGVKNTEDAIRYLENGPLKSYQQNGFGSFMILLKESGKAIGMCSLVKRDWLEEPDLGFALLPGYEGLGYAREASEECMRYFYNLKGLHRLQAIATPDNQPSIRLLTRLRFSFERMILPPGEDSELLLFARHKDAG